MTIENCSFTEIFYYIPSDCHDGVLTYMDASDDEDYGSDPRSSQTKDNIIGI